MLTLVPLTAVVCAVTTQAWPNTDLERPQRTAPASTAQRPSPVRVPEPSAPPTPDAHSLAGCKPASTSTSVPVSHGDEAGTLSGRRCIRPITSLPPPPAQ